MRRAAWFALAVFFLTPGMAAAEGGFAGFFRSLTGILGNRSDEPARRPVTATIGVRGMDEGGVTAAEPSEADLKRLDGWAANRIEAEAAARRRGVAARAVVLAER